jgi:predicted DCC family thiol-disulfide oxidoreductase YuxK
VKQIVFFDGVCNLCNGWIDFLAPRLKSNRAQSESVHFASLQGKTAAELKITNGLKSIVFLRESETLVESDAVLAVFGLLRFPWPLFRLFKFIPRTVRDGIYRWVARNRYRWWGKRAICRVPTEADRKLGSLFLE